MSLISMTSGLLGIKHFMRHQSCNSTTLIFERVYQPNLPKLGRKAKLKRRHHILYVKEEKSTPKELQVILMENSKVFGVKGEVVTLPKYFARKLIYGTKAAVYASADNLEKYALGEESNQTVTGRRMAFWLKSHPIFECAFPQEKVWSLKTENLSRCLQRDFDVLVPSSAMKLPDYEITNENAFDDKIHKVEVMVNGIENVEIEVKFVPR